MKPLTRVDENRIDEIMGKVHWLEETLIPDLEASGTTETAQDFKECVEYIMWLIELIHS